MSLPNFRDMITIIDKPSLASHALIVNIIIIIVGFTELLIIIIKDTNITIDNVNSSKDNKVISNWKLCIIIFNIVIITIINIKIIKYDIEYRKLISIFDLQDQYLLYKLYTHVIIKLSDNFILKNSNTQS